MAKLASTQNLGNDGNFWARLGDAVKMLRVCLCITTRFTRFARTRWTTGCGAGRHRLRSGSLTPQLKEAVRLWSEERVWALPEDATGFSAAEKPMPYGHG